MADADLKKVATKGYFVTGTDTGVGKTLISTALINLFAKQNYRVAGMKPVASGCDYVNGEWHNADALAMMAASNVQAPYKMVNPYAFEPAIAPHLAAGRVNEQISIALIENYYHQLTSLADTIIVEGAGGWLAPVNETESVADVALALELPVILVVGMRLGCLNHAQLSVQSITEKGAKLAGWVANGIDPQFNEMTANIETLKARIEAPCFGIIPNCARDIGLDQISAKLKLTVSAH